MKNQIYLKWCTGEMTIALSLFFPAMAKDVKKLLGIIRMDIQDKDHIESIVCHLNQRIKKIPEGDQFERLKDRLKRNVTQIKKAK